MIRNACLLFLSSLLALTACKNDLREVQKLDTGKPLPVSTTKNVEMMYSDSARLKARIKAPLRETYLGDESYIEFKKGIRVEFYESNGKLSSQLTAGYAINHTRKDLMEAKNNVIFSNSEGDKLNTEHLIWDQKLNRVYSEVFCKITSPDRVIYGEGFESKGDFSQYRILKIRGIINLKDE
jgi:LPS export ABC transporter protein LptC